MKLLTKEKNGALILYLSGRLDVALVEDIEVDYMEILQDIKKKILILDLSKVSYVSSSALRIFATTIKFTKEKDIRLIISGMTPSTRKIFELVEMINLFEVFDTTEIALKEILT
ncbi:MAG: STAS domain-containing protein [Leptospiraceae bacterium]|nr:STAS domain-containing protein [Leptospiraceae bacterium]MCP5500456.1 STAS domain-containing protein [Leptospiraceae bacterium]